MARPPMTIRRWTLTIFACAALTTTYIHASRAVRRSLYDTALRNHCRYQEYYAERRVTPLKYIEKSQELMDAEIALFASSRDPAAFILAHLDRVTKVVNRENRELFERGCCRGGCADAAEAAEYLDHFSEMNARPREGTR